MCQYPDAGYKIQAYSVFALYYIFQRLFAVHFQKKSQEKDYHRAARYLN